MQIPTAEKFMALLGQGRLSSEEKSLQINSENNINKNMSTKISLMKQQIKDNISKVTY